MRIINLKQFRESPKGTVFMKYVPCSFGELNMKGETWEYDFLLQNLVSEIKCESSNQESNILDKAENDNAYSVDLDLDCFSRDGCFEDDQLFAVYEQKDIDNLIQELKTCKGFKG